MSTSVTITTHVPANAGFITEPSRLAHVKPLSRQVIDNSRTMTSHAAHQAYDECRADHAGEADACMPPNIAQQNAMAIQRMHDALGLSGSGGFQPAAFLKALRAYWNV